MAVSETSGRARSAGADLARAAARGGNRVSVPAAWRLGLWDSARATAAHAGRCQLFAHAGSVAFRSLFALFPAIIALLWLARDGR